MKLENEKCSTENSFSRYSLMPLGVIVFYLYVFNPPFSFLPMYGSIYLLFPLMLCFLNTRSWKYLWNLRYVLLFETLILFYSSILTLAGGDTQVFKHNVYNFLTVPLLSTALIVFFYQNRISLNFVIVLVTFLATLFTIASYFIPEIKLSLMLLLKRTTDNDDYFFGMRGYGLADGFLYAYGISLAIVMIYLLDQKYHLKWWYYVLIVLTSFSILINARIGIVILAVGLLIFIIIKPVRRFPFAFIAMGTFFLMAKFWQDIVVSNETRAFVESFFFQMSDTLFGTDYSESNTLGVLTGDMMFFPDTGEELIFGTGKNVFLSYRNSDVGYVTQINYGGLIYFGLIVALVVCLLKKCDSKYFQLSAFLIFIIANLKGDFILTTGCFRLLFLLIAYNSIGHES